MFCSKCGKEIQGSARFCPGCGNPVGNSVDTVDRRGTAMQTAVYKKRGITPWFAFGIVMLIVVVAGVAVAVHGNPQRKYSRQISLAERYLNEMDYDKAIVAYRTAIRIDPKNAEAYLGLAEAYIGLGDPEKALEVLKEGYEQTGDKSIDRRLIDLANNEGLENVAGEEESGALIKEDYTDEKDTGEEETVNGLTFADIPSCFTYWTYTMESIGTIIEIENDGSFEGEYSAYINMETGPGYEDGTFYSNEFKGKFSQPVQIDEYTYSIKLEYISKESESEKIENGSRYVVEEPEGICNDSDLLLYLPGTPIDHMEEDMQFWINGVGAVGRSGDLYGGVDVLPDGYYGLYQPGNCCGFIGIKDKEDLYYMEDDAYIVFGRYEQDGDLSNGSEPIEWEVLERDTDKVLLVSRYILDGKSYNGASHNSVTWEKCSLRNWLNNDFFRNAFTPDDQKKIMTVTLSNPDNLLAGIDGGNNTQDKIFCLSLEELKNYYRFDYWDDTWCWGESRELLTERTPYAIEKGVFANEGGWWWLRSPGDDGCEGCRVESSCAGWSQDHSVPSWNEGVTRDDYDDREGSPYAMVGVRPAMFIRL